jgi:hypothetical protein
MSNDYELADDNRQDLIFTKEQLMAPLLPGMEQPPHPMRLGDHEQDYYVGREPLKQTAGAAAETHSVPPAATAPASGDDIGADADEGAKPLGQSWDRSPWPARSEWCCRAMPSTQPSGSSSPC